jgi:Leucine Rich repeat
MRIAIRNRRGDSGDRGRQNPLLRLPAVGDNAAMSESPKRKRRWLQFSLRSLLVFTAIVAVGCAWLGRKIERKRRERVTVAAINNHRGTVFYDSQITLLGKHTPSAERRGPEWLRKVLGENFFSEVKSVSFPAGANVSEDIFENVQVFTELETLDLVFCKEVTDAGLEHLKGLTQLQRLVLHRTQVTDTGLEHLKGLIQLQTLDLSSSNVTDAGLENLKGLTQLQILVLDSTKVTDAGLEHLKGLTQFQKLGLGATQITDAGLEYLKDLTQLQVLDLRNTIVTDAGLETLKGLTRLQTLILSGTNVTGSGLANLKGLTQLKTLSLMETKVSDAGLKDLQKALPNCMIIL